MTEENKAIVRRYAREFLNEGNEAVVDEIFAEDYVYHVPSGNDYIGRIESRMSKRDQILALNVIDCLNQTEIRPGIRMGTIKMFAELAHGIRQAGIFLLQNIHPHDFPFTHKFFLRKCGAFQ